MHEIVDHFKHIYVIYKVIVLLVKPDIAARVSQYQIFTNPQVMESAPLSKPRVSHQRLIDTPWARNILPFVSASAGTVRNSQLTPFRRSSVAAQA